MPNLTADLIVNHNLFAKTKVNGYDGTFTNIKTVFNPGLIGNVYSYIERSDGTLYWMVYQTQADYDNFIPTYIKHNAGQLSLPDKQIILDNLTAQQNAKELAAKGAVNYYIEKYAPYLIGAVVLSIALPSIINATKKK
jgi:hypothetical protein